MFISQHPINRQDHLRKNQAMLVQMWNDPTARVLPLHQGKCLVSHDTESPELTWMPVQAAWQFRDAIFLGTTGDIPWFALSLDDNDALATEPPSASEFQDLRKIGMRINDDDGALLIYAKGLTHWHSRTNFCSACGVALDNTQGGHVKQCSNTDCGQLEFPRTDPAVIMLVTHIDEQGVERCLLGRSPVWPPGMYSTLAGFVESGESLEQAVVREVFEEVGVSVENVKYITSQPWPFPRSIMLGFKSEATTTAITLDEQEIEDAQWFTREDLNSFGTWGDENFTHQLPRSDSIAHFLIKQWCENTH